MEESRDVLTLSAMKAQEELDLESFLFLQGQKL